MQKKDKRQMLRNGVSAFLICGEMNRDDKVVDNGILLL